MGCIIHQEKEIERLATWQQNPKNFLLHYDTGIYSCSRTINDKIYDWEDHLARMGTYPQRLMVYHTSTHPLQCMAHINLRIQS